MSVVYEAWDRYLLRRVALRVIDKPGASGGENEGLPGEVKTLAQLEHPGIVPVYDAGMLPDGRLYCAMRLVGGDHLDAFLSREASLHERLRVFEKVCDVIAFTHHCGVVHRNLNPQSVVAGKFGEVFVTDWGLAEWLLGSGYIPRNALFSSPRYMAPEQAGERSEPADGRADIFSLGGLLKDVMREDRPRSLAAVAAKAQAPDPADRYQHVEHLAADIRRFLDRLPVSAYNESVLERLEGFAERHRVLLLILATYVLVRLLLFFLS